VLVKYTGFIDFLLNSSPLLMLSFCNVSAGQAEHYYQKDDYYTHDEAPQSPSYWTGKGATTLGLEGAVDREHFVDLLHGLAPDGTFLLGRWVDLEKHRAATDYTFSAPKSVSIAALVQEDDRVQEIHAAAVATALSVLEKRYAQTRISTDKGRQRITTGNLIAAVFPHDTSRELEPQLHSHCVVINATQLPDEQWRSFSNEEVVQNQKLLGQIYQNELAHGLKQLGYEIEPKAHGQFEIAGYSPELLGAFSTRRHQIEELIKIWETERTPILDGNGNAIESRSARYEAATLLSRKTKPPAVERDKLQRGWSAFLQLKEIELPAIPGYDLDEKSEQLTLALDAPPMTAEMVIESGITHCSERESVFRRTKLERFVFENHLGEQKFSELEEAIAQSTDLIQVDKLRCTTQSALHLELNTIRLMQQGQGELEAISPSYPQGVAPDHEIQSYLENKNLTEGQREAVQLAIATEDQFIAIQGVAGAGKSYALDSVKAIAQAQGYEVKGYAPSAEAASVLGEAIGIQTETVSRLLISQNQKDAALSQPQLWIVDEAGLLSMRQAHDLLQKAQSQNARVILVGDRRQLSAVEAGNPFKSLQAGGIATARLDESLRQKTQDLRIAVKAIAQGNVSAGVQLLDQAGCIIETNPDNPGDQDDRLTQLVRDYTTLSPEERDKTLLLAGTNRERQELTQQIRTALQAEDALGQNHLEITGLRTKDMTTAQAQYVHSYEIGDVVVSHQDYKKQQLEKNQQYRVVDKDRASNRLTLASADGNEFAIDPTQCLKKSVYQAQDIKVAVGDRLRWSKNDTSAGIRNGQTFKVLGFEDQQTQIEYADGKTDRVNLNGICYVDYAWVSTTYSAQGKTAERVLATTDRTLNQEAFYVICSRAKYQLTLYTDDKAELLRLAQISRSKENVSDYLKLPALVHAEKSAQPLSPEVTDFQTEPRREEQAPSRTKPFITEPPERSHDSTNSPFDPERLRAWVADRLRTDTAAANHPASPRESELTAAISRLDFSAPTPAAATDDVGTEAGWDEQTGQEQPSPGASDAQSTRGDFAVEPGRAAASDARGDRPIDPIPEPASSAAEQPTREPTIAERFTQFADQLQREVESYRNRTGSTEPTSEPTIQRGGWNADGDRSRDESAEPEVAAPNVTTAEAGFGGEDLHVLGVDSVDCDGGELRDRLRLAAEPIPARDADADQWAGEQYRESAGENREVGETVEEAAVKEEAIAEPDYRQLWHEYHQRLQPRGYPVDQDRAIARCVLAERGVDAAYKIIAQSPRLESPIVGFTPTTYVQWVVSWEQYQMLPEEQQHRGDYAVRVIRDWAGLGSQSYEREGKRLVIKYDGQTETLTVDAKDGRGEILRAVVGHPIASALTKDDRQVFEGVDRLVEAQRRQEREVRRQKSKGLELD
jgi:conjugative relaxase-like TrwC/TraI family protein